MARVGRVSISCDSADRLTVTIPAGGGGSRTVLVTGPLIAGLVGDGTGWPGLPELRRTPLEVRNAPPADGWLGHNVDVLAALADAELGELVAIPRATAGYTRWGTFHVGAATRSAASRAAADRVAASGPAAGYGLDRFWALATAVLGPVPWADVRIVVGPHDSPLGLSFPGLVLLSYRLFGSPRRARWLYLTHELVHQWLGNSVRFPPTMTDEWEGWVDAVTWLLAQQSGGPAVGAAFRTLFNRYLTAGGELAERGRRVLACRAALDAGMVTLADLRPPTPTAARGFVPPPATPGLEPRPGAEAATC
jgi:hypothetical protein